MNRASRILPRLALAILLCASAFWSGCVRREVIVVPPGEPVQLAEPVKAHIFALDASGQLIRSDNRVEIPAGYWCLPDPGEPTQ